MTTFTSYDAIKFIDLVRKKPHGNKSSSQGFLSDALKLNPPITSAVMLKSQKELRQGETLLSCINSSKLSEAKRIENIRLNLFDDVAFYDKELCQLIKDASNINANDKKLILNAPDFAHRIYLCLLISLKNQSDDRNNNKFEEKEAYYKELQKTKLPKNVISMYENLKGISSYIHEDLFSDNSRFNYKIDETILSLCNFSSEKNCKMSLFFKSKDDLLILGDSGVGKSTLLLNEFNKQYENRYSDYIPLFIPLNKLKTSNLSDSKIKSYILSIIRDIYYKDELRLEFNPAVQEAILDELFSNKSIPRKVLFLLDGLNEVTSFSGLDKERLINEINTLAECPNVKIIITSRDFTNSDTSLKNFKHIYASGISDETLTNRLKKLPNNKELIKILHTPLFLLMYEKLNSTGKQNVKTRGDILYDYFNGNSSYGELLLLNDSNYNFQKKYPEYVTLLLDFVIPAIAAYMEINDSFSITQKEVKNIVDQISLLVDPFENDQYFNNRYGSNFTISIIARNLYNAFGSDTISLLTDHFSFLKMDSDKHLFFTHQYIKDYFASLFRLLSFRQRYTANDSLYLEYLHSSFDNNTLQLTYEIAIRSALCNLDILKAHLSDETPKKDVNYIHNLFSVLSIFNNKTLAGLEFKDFDLSNISLTKYSFYNGSSSAIFDRCTFSEMSFTMDASSKRAIRKVSFYDKKPAIYELNINKNEKYIKISDYKTNKELLITNLNTYNYYPYVDLSFANDMLISNDSKYIIIFDNNYKYKYFWVHNNESNTLNIYFLPDTTSNVYYCFYKDKLVTLINNSELYTYNLSMDFSPIYVLNSDNNYADDVNNVQTQIDYESMRDDQYRLSKTNISLTNYADDKLMQAFITGDNLILIFNSKKLSNIVYSYSFIKNESIKVISEDITSSDDDFDVIASTYGNQVFFNLANTIYSYDVVSSSINEVVTLTEINKITSISYARNVLYISTDSTFLSVDLASKKVAKINNTEDNYPSTNFISNDKYVVLTEYKNNNCRFYVFKYDLGIVYRYTCTNKKDIFEIKYLSDNKILLLYKSGYVALIDSISLSLIDVYKFDHSLVSVSYNTNKKHIAICFRTGKALYTTVLYELGTDDKLSFNKIDSLTNNSDPSQLLYSNNEKHLFEAVGSNLTIYDADNGYKKITTMELYTRIYYVKQLDQFLCLFTKDKNNSYILNVYNMNNSPNTHGHKMQILAEPFNFDNKYNEKQSFKHLIDNLYYIIPSSKDYKITSYKMIDKLFFMISDIPNEIAINCDKYNIIPEFAHIENINEDGKTVDYLYAINKNGDFIKTKKSEPNSYSLIAPMINNLLIKGCLFKNTKLSIELKYLIESNLGIID